MHPDLSRFNQPCCWGHLPDDSLAADNSEDSPAYKLLQRFARLFPVHALSKGKGPLAKLKIAAMQPKGITELG